MAITISGVTVVQGTGTYVKESVLEVTYTLAADGVNSGHAFNLEAQISLSAFHSAWMPAYLYPANISPDIVQTAASAGTHKILIRLPLTLSQSGIAPSAFDNWVAQLLVQVRAKDTTTNAYSSYAQNATPANCKAKLPTITTATMAHYIGGQYATVPYTSPVSVTLAGSNAETSPGNPSYYRVLRSSDLATSVVVPVAWATAPTFNFSDSDLNGNQSILAQVYDQYYNVVNSMVTYDGTHAPILQKTIPAQALVRLVGSTGSEVYTGIEINSDGSFTPNREVQVFVSAQSPLPMTFKILATSNVEPAFVPSGWVPTDHDGSPANNINCAIAYNSDNTTQIVKLTTDPTGVINNDYDIDATVTVYVEITDAAGNKASPSDAIRLNTRIYQTHFKPLQNEDATYRHLLYEVTTGGNPVPIPKVLALSTSTSRSWPDIFYPLSHSYPTDAFGVLNSAAAIAMGGVSNFTNDAVALTSDHSAVYLDDQGRPTTVGWTMDHTKDYYPMISSRTDNIVYWVLDNSLYGDYSLQFEWFDLNANAYGPPFNPQAPEKGDVLVIYDATAAGAMTITTNPATGKKAYTIANSSLLVPIAAYTGSGSNVINLTTGQRVNSNSQGGFTGGLIQGIPVVAMILYTDAAGSASGFKLKSSPLHQDSWSNYDVDNLNGELWVHKDGSIATAPGASDMTAKQLVANYYDRHVAYDCQAGTVTFDTALLTTDVVTADFSFWQSDTYSVPLLLASQDDQIMYEDASVYILPADASVLTAAVRGVVYENQPSESKWGRVTTHITWDKDSGILEWDDISNMPTGRRMVAEYTHHTYKRITRDGFGDLVFTDPIIVADSTPAYPDYTYADIKITNEGDAMLEQGQITFVPRGLDTDGRDGVVLVPGSLPAYPIASDIVDQVLDIDRPWDVQKGTSDETCNRMACALNANYIWSRGCIKSGGTDPNDQSATGILSTWKSQTFPNNLAARGYLYGRVVWCLCGTSGVSYPSSITAGSKRCSVELQGKYYTALTI